MGLLASGRKVRVSTGVTARVFPFSRPVLGPTQPFLGSFPSGKRPGRGIDNPPLSSPEVRTEQSYNSILPRAWKACYGETGRSQGSVGIPTNLDAPTC
jgi:hypothetical protein